jgi:PAS domain S-box-containing protein
MLDNHPRHQLLVMIKSLVRRTLMRRLIIGFLITAILPLTGFALFNLSNFEKVLTNTILDNMEFVADRKAFKINHYIEDSRTQLNVLSHVPDVMLLFDELKQNYYAKDGIHSAAYLQSDFKARTVLNQIIDNYNYYDLFLIDESGEVIFSLKKEADFATNLQTGRFKNTGLADGFHKSMDFLTTEFSAFSDYEPSNAKLAAFTTVPLLKSGSPVGVLVAQTNLEDYLPIILDKSGLGETGEAVLAKLSETGTPIFVTPLRYSKSNRTDVAVSKPMKLALNGQRGKGHSIDYAGNEVVAAWQYLPDLHWGMVVKINKAEAFAPFEQLRFYTFLALGFLIIFVIVTAWIIGKSIVNPVRDLINVTNKISKGDLNQRASINYCDNEFIELAQTFNHMAEQIKQSYAHLERRVETRTFELNVPNKEMREVVKLQNAILDHSSHPIIATTPEGIITVFNKAAETMLGYHADEMIGKQTPVIIHDLNEVIARNKEFSAELHVPIEVGFETFVIKSHLGLENEHEWTYIAKNGQRIDVLLSVNALQDETGIYITGYIGIAVNITARKAAEKALKISQDNLSHAQQVAKICSWHINTENELCWSDETYEIFGIQRNHLITNDDFLNHIHPEDCLATQEAWQSAMQNGSYHFVHRIIANGVVKWVRSQAELVLDSQHNLVYAIGTVQDITAQKHIEIAMRESETRFRSIFERASIGIAFADDNGNILQANQCFLDLIGFSWTELEGVSFSTFTYKDDLALELPLFQAILDNKADYYRIEKRYFNKSGAIIWVDVNVTVIRDDNNQPTNFVGLVIDITERKNAEAQLVEAKHIAENANRAKSEFLANMSHEIRTPMNAVLGLTQLVLETELNHRQRDFLTKVYSSSKALLSILNDILDYSKIEAGRLDIESVPCHLETILMNVADLFSAKLSEKALELFFEIAPETPYTILSDPLRINQILNNLVSNAIKFTTQGEIQIKVKPLQTQGNVQTLQFSVCDTGIGLSPLQIESLFQPFMQADSSISRKYGGTGLGLAICYRLVHLMNGEISVSSVQGQGSTFSFTIDVELPNDVENSLVELQKLKGQRVLVVDDQLTSVTILQNLLEAWGMDVDIALSGREALDKINQAECRQNCFDAVLLDWHMPDIDGLDVARQLREHPCCGHSLVIIMVTAYDKQELFIKSAELNITNVLTKPIIPSTVFNALLDNPNHPVHLYQSRKVEDGEKVLLGMRVLLVEDHKINQQVATEFLTSRGANVTIANHGVEAISHFENTEFDAILMDLHMPEMDGLEATRRIRALPKGDTVPIIAMTAAVMSEDRDNCLDAGMVDFIAKPVQVEQLIQVLCRWVKKEHFDIEINANAGQLEHSALDISAALKRLNGNYALLSRLLSDFVSEHTQTIEQLNLLLANQEFETVTKLLHSIKGVSSNLGANSLSQSASQLEKQIKDEVELTALPLFALTMQQTLTTIEEFKLNSKSVTTSDSGDSLSSQELLPLLEALRPYLENSDFLPESLLEPLRAVQSQEPIKTLLERLWNQLDAFDYNGALTTLEQLIPLISDSTL